MRDAGDPADRNGSVNSRDWRELLRNAAGIGVVETDDHRCPVPSVAMKALTPILVTMKPLTTPIAMPMRDDAEESPSESAQARR